MADSVKIAIADDEELFRQGMSFILSKEMNFEIVMQAKDGMDLLNQLEQVECYPDVILMDLKMPGLNGVEATKVVKKKYPNIYIVALTSYYSKPFITNMIQVGAVAYLTKNASPKSVVHTLNEVADKGFYYDDEVLKVIYDGMLNPSSKPLKSRFDASYLTKREIQVLDQICKQKTTNEIADALCISPRTVEGHRNNLLLKTESKNSAGLVVYAIQNKIISIDDKF